MTQEQQTQTKEAPKLKAILARKLEMTQFFDAQGLAYGATVLEAGPCRILTVRTKERDGYDALQLGFGVRKRKNLSRPILGKYPEGTDPSAFVKEIRLKAPLAGLEKGSAVTVEGMFATGDYVDVRGVSKGHGFAGGVKRWGFRGGPATHGQSDRERAPGSLAGRRSLGRVLPGKKMAGHMGVDWMTIPHLEVLKVDPQQNRLYVWGGIPGPRGAFVIVRETVKSRKKKLAVAAREPASSKKKPAKAAAPAKK